MKSARWQLLVDCVAGVVCAVLELFVAAFILWFFGIIFRIPLVPPADVPVLLKALAHLIAAFGTGYFVILLFWKKVSARFLFGSTLLWFAVAVVGSVLNVLHAPDISVLFEYWLLTVAIFTGFAGVYLGRFGKSRSRTSN
jgi:hypothetical protein